MHRVRVQHRLFGASADDGHVIGDSDLRLEGAGTDIEDRDSPTAAWCGGNRMPDAVHAPI
jgi:hypothetical protein